MTTTICARADGLAELPLSALQERIWFLCTSYTGDASPILFLVWRIGGGLAADAWLRAVSAMVDRHEGLRTTFALREGEPVQLVHAPGGFDTEIIDLGHLTPEQRE